jgi:Neocarzinostatin family
MGTRRVSAVAVAAAALLWLTPATTGAQTEPESVPTITVTPHQDLVDGQSVAVDGTGLTPGAGVTVIQCRPGSVNLFDVQANCELRTGHTTDSSGTFSAFVAVEREIQTFAGALDCAASPGACTVGVFVGFSLDSTVVETPIAFADPTLPTPTVTVTPASSLDDGDVVTVAGAGFPAGAQVDVALCQSNRPVTAEWCAASPAFTATADATGAFTGTLTIRRAVTLPSGQQVDCVVGCVVAASTGDGAIWAVDEIALIRRTVLAIASNPLTVTPNGSVDLAGFILCTDPYPGGVVVEGVIAQTVGDRTITASFSASTTCDANARWQAQVRGSRAHRFQPGPARVTTWANEALDPFPDDSASGTVDINLVRRTKR